MLSPLLVIDNSICSGFECPLTLGLCVYFAVLIIACCCCYPGSCLCGQGFKGRKAAKANPAQGFDQLNFLGSIADVLKEEEKKTQEESSTSVESPAAGGLFRRRKRSQANYY